jgi:hypothetical protein
MSFFNTESLKSKKNALIKRAESFHQQSSRLLRYLIRQ